MTDRRHDEQRGSPYDDDDGDGDDDDDEEDDDDDDEDDDDEDDEDDDDRLRRKPHFTLEYCIGRGDVCEIYTDMSYRQTKLKVGEMDIESVSHHQP